MRLASLRWPLRTMIMGIRWSILASVGANVYKE